MIGAFRTGEDIHTITASQVFGMPPEMVTPLMRSRAKAVNFGIVYGIGAFSLSKDINVSRKEAQRYIDDYLTLYSGVDRYMKEVVEKAKEDGYVETLFGRRLYLPEINGGSGPRKKAAERAAINAPMQGTAADIIKRAMIAVDAWLEKEKPRVKMIMQVHDELVFEVHKDDLDAVSKKIHELMESSMTLDVPLLVEVGSGENWDQAH